jgi:hypothetical protein
MTLAAIAFALPLAYLLASARSRADEERPSPWSIDDGLALLTPLGLFALLNHDALASWWTHDDPCLLRSLAENGVWAHFTEPETWRRVSATLLMPWIMASFGFDRISFGLEPSAFYAHQLLSFALFFVVAYTVLRRFLAPPFAGLALSIIAVSLPTFAVAQQLMNRTYVEGLTFALAGVALYHRSLVRGRAAWAVAGAGAYALAATAKEVFVPLVVALPLLAAAGVRLRLRHWVPYALVAAAYTAWRIIMLTGGNAFSTYGAFAAASPSPAQVAASFGLAGAWPPAAGVVVCVASFLVVGRASPRAVPFSIAVAAATIVPLATLGAMFAPRHAFVPSFACSVLVAAALERLRPLSPRTVWANLSAAVGLALLAAAWGATASADLRWEHVRSVRHHRAEGSFVLGDASGALLMTTLNDVSYLSCMRALGAAAGPGFCGDACFCAGAFPRNERWAYDGERVVRAPLAVDPDCASDSPLDAEVRYDSRNGSILWRAGPYADGRYEAMLVFDPSLPAISVPIAIPPRGDVPFWLRESLGVLVRYESPAGWLAYSTLHTLKP